MREVVAHTESSDRIEHVLFACFDEGTFAVYRALLSARDQQSRRA